MSRLAPFLLLTLLVACTADPPATPRADRVVVAADSLIFILADSSRVWLTTGRTGTASDGTTCREHGVRVAARGGEPRLVPLLYVQESPRIDRGGRVLATLSTNCRPGAVYEIDPATAQPTLLREGTR